jgi:hypothetical protein
MMKTALTSHFPALALLTLPWAGAAGAATLTALTTFGGGDGTLVPTDFGGGTGNTERHFAFNPTTGNLALVSRQTANRVDIIDGVSGAFVKTMTAPSGGYTSSVLNITAVGIATDGQIFTTNLADGSNANPSLATLSVYRWSSEASNDAAVGITALLPTGIRLGDSSDAFGIGSAARLMLGTNDTNAGTVHPGDNGFIILDPFGVDPLKPYSAATGSASSAFRLSAAFIDGQTAIGNLNGVTRIGTFDTAGNLSGVGSVAGLPTTERHADVVNIGGTQYLATLSSVDATTRNRVSVWQLDGFNATLLASTNLLGVGTAANANGTGDIEWGNVTGDSATLYSLTTNHGIQAFTFTVPEPGSAILVSAAGSFALLRRRRR